MRSSNALLDRSIHSAQSFYRARGRSRAMVTGEVEESDGSLTVTLDIEPGPVVRITDVRLEGMEQLTESTLRKSMLTDKRVNGRHALLAGDLIDGDRDALYRVYYSSGFMDVRVLPADVEFPESEDAATVVFTIEEGPRRKLLDVQLDGNDLFETEELKSRLSVPEEGWVDTRVLDQIATEIAAAYHEQGFPEATALWSLEPLDDGARATFKISEGLRIEIGEIIVSGNQQVKERTIRRELTFATGEPLRRDRLLETQRRLRQKGMFQSVVIRSRPTEDREGVWDVVVRVRERDMLDLSVGVGFDDTERWRVSFSVGRHLIAGRAGSVWFNVRWGDEVSVGNLATGWRQVAGSRNDFLGSVGFSQRKRDGFTEEGPFLFAQVNRPLTERTTVLAQYEIQDVRFSSFNLTVTDPEDNAGLLSSISAGLVRTTIDDPALPRSGGLGAADLALFSEYVGSDYEFLRLVVGQSLVFGAKSGRFTSLSSARIGFSWPYGNTITVPLTERFFAGGIGSVRGYDRDELGPKDPVTGDPIGGASLFVFTQEFRIQVAKRSFLHLFVDGGNVFFRPVDFAFNDMEFTFGPGFSLATPAGPVAIFYGHKIDPDPDEDPGRWHFTFGRIF
jgi:outer membrane protein insertion porin family